MAQPAEDAAMDAEETTITPAPAPGPSQTQKSGPGGQPSQTIYVNNLNEKIKKDALKKSLYSVFSQFGKIIDIVCCRGMRLRGQAWVVFAEIQAATTALRQMQGFPFYDKPMRIAYAKAKSDVIAKADGTYVKREKRKRLDPPSNNNTAQQRPATLGVALALPAAAGDRGASAQTPAASLAAEPPRPPKQPKPSAAAPPSNVLFVQSLPEDCTDVMLAMLFQQYTGFKEVRMVPGKKGIAFVEFADDVQASLALAGLNGFKLTPTHPLNLTFAKR